MIFLPIHNSHLACSALKVDAIFVQDNHAHMVQAGNEPSSHYQALPHV